MTFYKLKSRYALRGWERLPYAITDTQTGTTTFIDEMTFQALSFCSGKFDVDNFVVLPAHKDIILKLKEKALVEECSNTALLEDGQKYKLFPCRFIHSAQWSITGKCNFRCRHCYMSAPDGKYGELSHEQCMYIVDQLSAAGISRVSLTGGEPLIRGDFFDIADALLAKKIVITQIYSNGALVSEKLLDGLERRGIRPEFSISFDGAGCHDWLRGIAGAEKLALDALKLLREKGFSTSVEMSLHKGNLHTIEETVNLLASAGVEHIKATPTTDSGTWINEQGKYTLDVKELYDAYLEYLPKYKAAGAPAGLMLGGFFMCARGSEDYRIPCKKFDGSEKMLRQPICGSARNTMYIAADGKLLPCIPLTGLPIQDEMPNILDTGLIKALSDSNYLRAIDTRLCDLLSQNKKCSCCEHKLYCGGGCRASALISDGEYLGCDEYACFFFKNGYEDKIKSIY